jgi:hypothetical protein
MIRKRWRAREGHHRVEVIGSGIEPDEAHWQRGFQRIEQFAPCSALSLGGYSDSPNSHLTEERAVHRRSSVV